MLFPFVSFSSFSLLYLFLVAYPLRLNVFQEKQSQRPWPKDRIWSFKTSPKVFGSPTFDAVRNNTPLDKEMVHWLKHRPAIFQAMWDR